MVCSSSGNPFFNDFRKLIQQFAQTIGLSKGRIWVTLHQGKIVELEVSTAQQWPLLARSSPDVRRKTLPTLRFGDFGSVLDRLEPVLQRVFGEHGTAELAFKRGKLVGIHWEQIVGDC